MTKIEWKWLGTNEFVPGCPARDLAVGEAKARGIERLVETSKLYERVEMKTAKKEKQNGS